MHLEDMQHACRVVALQGALLGLMREVSEQSEDGQFADGLTITAQRDTDGSIAIDMTYTAHGVPVGGEGL